MALTAFLEELGHFAPVDLEREFRLDVITQCEVAERLIGFAIAWPPAFRLRNSSTLIDALPSQRLVTAAVEYWLRPCRLRLSLAASRELFTFSNWIVLGDVLPPVQGQMVTMSLVRFTDVAAVGLCAGIRLCCELPPSERAAPVRVASSARHARVEEGRAMLHDVVLGIPGLQARTVVPMSAGLTLCGVDLVPLGISLPWRRAKRRLGPRHCTRPRWRSGSSGTWASCLRSGRRPAGWVGGGLCPARPVGDTTEAYASAVVTPSSHCPYAAAIFPRSCCWLASPRRRFARISRTGSSAPLRSLPRRSGRLRRSRPWRPAR